MSVSRSALEALSNGRAAVRGVCFALLLWPAFVVAAASAAEKRDCSSVAYDDDLSNLSLAAVAGGKVSFVANESDKAGCPSASAPCKSRAFLVDKDVVVLDGRREGGYVCAGFINAKGEETDGWLPAASVKSASPSPNWIGVWKRDTSSKIDITRKSNDAAEVSGYATYGVGAATHEGDIDGTIDPRQAAQSFASDGDKQVAYEKAGQYDCAVRLRQLGAFLFVSDNNNCGGANVSFSGLYTRR
jgi:hypothetical protein